ncbi:DUF2971 domain-containing protein [Flavobacterium sp. M31R6]|uniref:DUF2971 domain-containing protein n=1 Tax=Flavobacterium sp. M31R6 TaxID=2739062 RepID=UPI001567E725|nr:DUF2971 domain-containing protein [Flavobacterium sp. M31R6]QKJ63892.1 DUF2971 domain-containing protein [Flavobacterium sp. M31R6]
MEKFKVDSKLEILFKNEEWQIISNGIPLETSTKNLFKYYSLTEFNIDALENNYFYLSNPKDFNDPFDCSRNLIIENQKELSDWQYVESLNNNSKVGITCFSKNGLEPLMWSHYANSYRGFCIKLKPKFVNSANEELIKLKRVIYSNDPKAISTQSKFSKYYQLIVKLENWSYEEEWRLLFKNPISVLNKFYYNEDSIEEISVGYQFFDVRTEAERKLKERFFKLREGKFKNIPLYTVGPYQTKLELQKLSLIKGTVDDGLEKIAHLFKK